MAEVYRTIKQGAVAEFVEKRSRFLGAVLPVTTEAEALTFIQQKKQQYFDAKHNVFAYRLREGGVMRYSDDGEPQGTAGMPTLDVLCKADLVDVVVVTTRYFGGILLGGGGLVRAYSHTAHLAVEAGGICVMERCALCKLSCDYGQYCRLSTLVPALGGVVDDSVFTDSVTLSFHLPEDMLPYLEKQVTEATAGTVTVKAVGTEFFEKTVE